MPKGKGKRSQPATRKKGPRVTQIVDENLSGDDENAETQSIASQTSTGTHSFEDGAELSDEVDEIEDFEHALAQHIDATTQKSAKGRQTALSAVAKALRSRILSEFVSERKMTILDGVERCLKRGQSKDRMLAADIGGLVCIQLGSTVDSEEVFRTLKCHLMTVVQDPTVDPMARARCANSLGLCCFITSEDPEEFQEITSLYEGIFDTNKTIPPSHVPLHCSTLLAWALVLSIMPHNQAHKLITKHLRRVTHMIESSLDVNLKVIAGEVLALMYEMGRDVDKDFGGASNELCDLLRDLATDGSKHVAKKDRRVQRAGFRDILRAIEDGSVPDEVVKFGSEYIELDCWSRRRQYMAFKEALGTGVNVHLQENELLRDIFDLGAPVKAAEVHKASRFERQFYHNAATKARTLNRGKHRDKRNASIYYSDGGK